MSNLLSALLPRKSERMDQNDWAAWAQNMFTYQGNSYPIGAGLSTSDSSEKIENDFVGYVEGAYKQSGIVFAAMVARMLIFTEARFQWQRLNNGRPGDLFGTPQLSIFEKPWPNGQTADLLARAIQDADLCGNHYVVTEGFGDNTRLRRLRPDWTDIILTAPPDKAVKSDVAGYLHRPGNTMDKDAWELYPINGSKGTVAHWAPFPDPEAQYRGMSPLTPIITEIISDKAMIKHKQKFFENAATPPIAVSLKETVTPEQFKEFMKTVNRTSRGVDNAYNTLYLGGGADVKVIGANLQQINFATVAGHGETRICAALRIHPCLVGVAENIHGSELNAGNFTAAKNLLIDGTMRPLWRGVAQAYSVLVPDLKNARLWYDDRDIAFLREDRQAAAEVQSEEASTINSLIQTGFTADSSIRAVKEHDWSLLQHTGRFSVQLVVPGEDPAAGGDANTPSGGGSGSGGDANTPDKSDSKNTPQANPSDDTE